ncbi:hypothetical protein [Salana multivorans]
MTRSAVGVVAGARGGPVSDVVGWPGSNAEYGAVDSADIADTITETRTTENAIAVCMAGEGFEYWPKVPTPDQVEVSEGGPLWGTPEYVEEYGYGMWTAPSEGMPGISFTYTDPPDEIAYLAAMSDAEREAYDEALMGPIVDEGGEDGGWTREGGCYDQAQRSPSARDDVERTYLEQAYAFLDGLPDSAAFDELNAEWAACMHTEGYTDASPAAARLRVGEEAAQAGSGSAVGGSTTTAEGRARELEVALADLDCQREVDYVARYDAIDLAEQEAYAQANAAELSALEAWLAR